MAITTYNSWTYPDSGENPYYTSFSTFVESVDAAVYSINSSLLFERTWNATFNQSCTGGSTYYTVRGYRSLTEANMSVLAPSSFTMYTMYCALTVAPGGTETVDFTVFKNGSSQAELTLTMTSSQIQAANTTGTIAFEMVGSTTPNNYSMQVSYSAGAAESIPKFAVLIKR